MPSIKATQYRAVNRALISTVNKEMFKVDFDIDVPFYPRFLLHPADRGGCGHYRMINPFIEMGIRKSAQGYVNGAFLKPHELGRFNPDALITQRQVLDGQVNYLHRVSTLNGVPVIYDLDDLLDGVQDKNIHKKDFNQRHFNNLYRVLGIVDRMVCSTEFLKEQYQKYCSNIVVQHNRLRPSVWKDLQSKRATSAKPRIGWSGGFSHSGDLEIIIPVVEALYKHIDFVFFGYVHPQMEKYIAEYHCGVDVHTYPAKLASLNLDLAVIPLEDVRFNHAKSHIKVLEFGALGVPIVATNITPYKNFPIQYPSQNTAQAFKEKILEVLADRDAMYRMGDETRDFIYANWMLDDAAVESWKNTWLMK